MQAGRVEIESKRQESRTVDQSTIVVYVDDVAACIASIVAFLSWADVIAPTRPEITTTTNVIITIR